ncbi:MAG: phosphoesterase [Gemmataceae bacterium]|nr:phosphoesterase [Gemmataceae bacterium]
MNAEQVLVVPTALFHEAGRFQGLSRDVDRYLPRLLAPPNVSFIARAAAEQDPGFKQIIPYVVMRWRDQVFHYRRGQGTTEARLRALRSVGVGGHINPCDHAAGGSPYRLGMLREVEEEVFVETGYRERCVGLINDDATPVGQVHLGIVHVFDLDEPRVRRREADLIHSGFAPLAELLAAREEFETWSQFVLEELTRQHQPEA